MKHLSSKRVVLTLLCIWMGSISLMAQQLNVRITDGTLQDVITAIESQSSYKFNCNDVMPGQMTGITLNLKGASVKDVLNSVFQNTPFEYQIGSDNVVTVSPKSDLKTLGISGTIVDKTKQPVIGAYITIEGFKTGTSTDLDGKFVLSDVPANAALQVSCIGYATQRIAVNGKAEFNILLEEDSKLLDEVVVVGYGVQKKVNLTGSVSVVEGDELTSRPVANITQSLQGMVPGLNVTVGNQGGTPGSSFSLNIRGKGNLSGSDNPYVLVDGVESNLSRLNPNDIESISVLKDAAASAIYGARAAYGVILITTKSGKEGKATVSYDGNVAAVRPMNLPKPVNSYEFAKFYNHGHANAGLPAEYSDEKIEQYRQFCENPVGVNQWPEQDANIYDESKGRGIANTNVYKLHYKDVSIKHSHNLAVRGGSKDVKYYVSGGYYDEDGTLRYADIRYRRVNFNASMNANLFKWMRLKVNTKYDNSFNRSPFNEYYTSDNFYHILQAKRPTQPMFDLNGYPSAESNIPVLQSGNKTDTKTSTLTSIIGLEIEPVKGWKINVDYHNKFSNVDTEVVGMPIQVHRMDGTTYYRTISTETMPLTGAYKHSMNRSMYDSFNVLTSYNDTFNEDHNFSVMLGMQYEHNRYSNIWGSNTDLISFTNPGLGVATGEMKTGEAKNQWATLGYFGRINYDYKGKYLIELNARYDGSSRFMKDNRWGFFPSASIGWNIAREGFMKNANKWVNNLKIRVSYGHMGNQAGAGLYTFAQMMNTAPMGNWYFNGGNREMIIYAPGAFNEDVTWEKVESADIGIDFGFFDNRLTGGIDLYQRTTRDMLGPTQAFASMYGRGAPRANNATMRNRGWEFNINWKGTIGKDWNYSVGGMVSDYVADVIDYQNPTLSNPQSQWYPGKRAGEIWGYHAKDLIQTQAEADEFNKLDHKFLSPLPWTPGDVKFEDINGDGKLDMGKKKLGDMGDMTVIGNSLPRYQFSIQGSISWKGLSLYMLWQGVGKRNFAPGNSVFFTGSSFKAQTCVLEEHLDYWSPENPDAYLPKPYVAPFWAIWNCVGKTINQTSTRYLQDASYIRLKNLVIGYDIPAKALKKIRFNRINIFLSGENLLTFTKLMKTFDPETCFAFKEGGKGYVLNQVYSLGLNLSF